MWICRFLFRKKNVEYDYQPNDKGEIVHSDITIRELFILTNIVLNMVLLYHSLNNLQESFMICSKNIFHTYICIYIYPLNGGVRRPGIP